MCLIERLLHCYIMHLNEYKCVIDAVHKMFIINPFHIGVKHYTGKKFIVT